MSTAILAQESSVVEVVEAAITAGVELGVMLALVKHCPEWANAYEWGKDEEQRATVTYSREVGTVEIRQTFLVDAWEPADEALVYFYGYQEAREQGLPRPEVSDVMRAMEVLRECGAWSEEVCS